MFLTEVRRHATRSRGTLVTEFTPTIISVDSRTGKGRDSDLAGSTTSIGDDSTVTPPPDKLRLYEQIIHRLPAALYTCDAEGRVMLCNQAAVNLWGRAPLIGQDRWCGALRILRMD